MYAPTGKVIHRDKSVNFLPAIGTLLGRYVVWTVAASLAASEYRSLIFDSLRGRTFITGDGIEPKIGTIMVRYQLTYSDFPESVRAKLLRRSHRCFHVQTWKEHVVDQPDRCGWSKPATPRPR